MTRPVSPLPIDDLIPDLLASLETIPNAVVVAAPGAGKTTRVPPALLGAPWLKERGLVVLQPRRVAARSTATRIAAENRWRIGEEIGWQIRFDNRTSARTRLRVATEGILLRQLQSDPMLEGVGAVVLDEFHERSVYTDMALAMLRELQGALREDLRIIVMSATLDAGPVAHFLGDCPVFESAGRMYPVAISHREKPTSTNIHAHATHAIHDTLSETSEGHVLVFLPGMGEIRRTASALSLPANAEMHILHSSVSAEDQDRALAPTTRRKVILATNIAETSITIDGVRTVIDSGLERRLVHDPAMSLDKLELRRVSLASADQRSGRAGRTAPGTCIRLWSRAEEAFFDPHAVPEICRVDLAGLLLSLHDYGVSDPASFAWFESPEPARLDSAEELLRTLGATGKDGTLTTFGRQLARLPLHPRLGLLLLEGHRTGLAREAAAMAAVLSERDIYTSNAEERRGGPRWSGRSDVLDRTNLVLGSDEASARIDTIALRIARDTMRSLLSLLPRQSTLPNPTDRDGALCRLLLRAYPDRVTLRRSADPTRGRMVGGRGVLLDATSILHEGPMFLSIDPREATTPQGLEFRVSIASAIEPEWLAQQFPERIDKSIEVDYDDETDRTTVVRQHRYRDLVFRTDGLSPRDYPAEVSDAIGVAAAERIDRLMTQEPALASLFGRLAFLNRIFPETCVAADGNPLDRDSLLKEAARSANVTSLAAFIAKSPARLIQDALPWPLRQSLDREAPTHVEVPTGNRIPLDYTTGEQPVLAVRLQEMFGLAETPTIASGRVPVLLHLLSPNRRPVQITADLSNFWNSTYAEVRKELRARYPKHAWPEDPWNEPPTARTKRRPR